MAGTNILCTESFMVSNFALKSGQSSDYSDVRMMSVSEILAKYQVSISGDNTSTRRPCQTEINAVAKGTNWTTVSSSYNFTAVAYGNGIFVALPQVGGYILYSVDGTTWATMLTGNSNIYWSIAYGNGIWVACGNAANSMTSTSGVTGWTQRTASNQSGAYPSIEFLNGYFLLCYNSGNWNGRSSDGITWTSNAAGNSGWADTAWNGASKYIRVGSASGSQFKSSPDGINWTALQNQTSMKNPYVSVAYGAGLFVAQLGNIGGGWPYPSQVGNLTSPDGVTWTLRSPSPIYIPRAMRFGNGVFVCVGQGYSYTPYCIITVSTDGINWTNNNMYGSYVAVAYGNGIWVAVGYNLIGRADG